MSNTTVQAPADSIAVIGMAGRFPGANNIDEFWQHLRDGVESVTHFSDEELKAEGVDRDLLSNPRYVKAAAIIDDIDMFDAAFFGFTAREAALTDPQHRIFMECAWEALEHAGYNPQASEHLIGLFAGSSTNAYLYSNILSNRDIVKSAGMLQIMLGNDKDHLATRVSYKLNLKGPSLAVQTACSTSLVAVHIACQNLLHYQCDIALAGGISIKVPQKTGYLHAEGSITSPDGHCRAFDADAQGVIGGSGAGVVVLKRLAEAVADGDYIHAIIRGSAVNNDGGDKVGYTAPGIEGQAAVIVAALAAAEVEAGSISYVETHGTGTKLGDPIEVSALTRAFRATTDRKQFCAIGSVKTNIGHLDAAAGVAGLIKTILALKNRMLIPSLNFNQPNPQIDFAASPFYVNTQSTPWPANGSPRRAGVSSFGMGGTNAHVILEEAREDEPSLVEKQWHLLPLSAHTSTALETMTTNLAVFLRKTPEVNLADVAYTLQVGRKTFNHRRFVICSDVDEAVQALETKTSPAVVTNVVETGANEAFGSLDEEIQSQSDRKEVLDSLGRLWLAGARVDWSALHEDEKRHRVALPSYPFERQRYWIDPLQAAKPVQNPATNVDREIVSPRNEIEESIVAIWKKLFGIEKVSVNDNFFDLGGHSLLAIQLDSQLREAFGIELSIDTIFEAPTVVDLANVIFEAQLKREYGDIDQLLASIENLSNDAVEQQIAEELVTGAKA
jgi:acyl transferase domain-containing protein